MEVLQKYHEVTPLSSLAILLNQGTADNLTAADLVPLVLDLFEKGEVQLYVAAKKKGKK